MLQVHTSFGPLQCQVRQGDDAPPQLGVILCHGFGAPGDDLVPLAAEMMQRQPRLARGVRFVFPEAPLSLAAHGFGSGRAWWEIDLERRIAIQNQGGEALERLRDEVPPGLPAARRSVMACLDAFMKSTGLPFSRVVLGGFSQGAMVTTDVTLALEEAPAALCLWSGTVLSRKDWVTKAPRRAGLRVFQSHGRLDPILKFADAEALRGLLTHAGLEVEFLPFDGPHTIPLEALVHAGALIASRLPPARADGGTKP